MFSIDCSPGMTGTRTSGCNPSQVLSSTHNTNVNTMIEYDLGNVISKRVDSNDLQLTIGIYLYSD
jgi:hypothetical protein